MECINLILKKRTKNIINTEWLLISFFKKLNILLLINNKPKFIFLDLKIYIVLTCLLILITKNLILLIVKNNIFNKFNSLQIKNTFIQLISSNLLLLIFLIMMRLQMFYYRFMN